MARERRGNAIEFKERQKMQQCQCMVLGAEKGDLSSGGRGLQALSMQMQRVSFRSGKYTLQGRLYLQQRYREKKFSSVRKPVSFSLVRSRSRERFPSNSIARNSAVGRTIGNRCETSPDLIAVLFSGKPARTAPCETLVAVS